MDSNTVVEQVKSNTLNISRLQTELDNISNKRLVPLEGFVKNDAFGIERELSASIRKHLETTLLGFKLVAPDFPKVLRDPETGTPLTELDGVFLLTNDPSVQELSFVVDYEIDFAEKERSKTQRVLSRSLQKETMPIKTYVVIIEAKHYIDERKVKEKLVQMEKIRDYITIARDMDSYPYVSKKFRKNVETFKFNKFEPQPMFFIGGVYWEGKTLVKSKAYLKTGEITGIVYPSGSRYMVLDKHTSTLVGGRKNKAKYDGVYGN